MCFAGRDNVIAARRAIYSRIPYNDMVRRVILHDPGYNIHRILAWHHARTSTEFFFKLIFHEPRV